MAAKTWTLFDQTTNEHAGYQEFGDHADFTVHKSGLAAGVEMVTLDNGKMKIHVLPTRGMSIWKAFHGDEAIDWKSPVRGPVHPSFVPLSEPSGLGWLDGFDELLVRCGLESNGAPEHDETTGRLAYPLHGRIGNKPAYKVELSVDGDEIKLTGWVEEKRFHFFKVGMKSTLTTKLNSTSFDIEDEITNLSASPVEVQMLYHMNFGLPLLDAGSQVVAPIKELVPRNDHAASGIDTWNSYTGETPGFEEQVYFATLQGDSTGETRTLLKNAHGTRGAVLRFNTQQLPCFSVWKNTTAAEDGYVTGIEPGTNYPNPRTYEGQQGRVLKLAANAKSSLHLGFDYCPSEAAVNDAEAAVKALQVATPKINTKPLDGWCA